MSLIPIMIPYFQACIALFHCLCISWLGNLQRNCINSQKHTCSHFFAALYKYIFATHFWCHTWPYIKIHKFVCFLLPFVALHQNVVLHLQEGNNSIVSWHKHLPGGAENHISKLLWTNTRGTSKNKATAQTSPIGPDSFTRLQSHMLPSQKYFAKSYLQPSGSTSTN